MNLIFMGTPEFALPALQSLINSAHNVICVYTRASRPAGRGHKERKSRVHELAEKHGIEVRTPISLKDPITQQAFKELKADAAIVAAYGLLLPESILNSCGYGCINIHPSLLPRWRGAAPIQRTILAADKETGVCIMKMDKGLDTGAILATEKLPLAQDITTQQLHDLLANKGAELLIKTLDNIDNINPVPQSETGVTYAEKLKKEEGKIDWNQSAEIIDRKVRALNPWPGTYFIYNGENIKILAGSYKDQSHQYKPGTVINDMLSIACSEGIYQPSLVQRQGRMPIKTEEFLKGFKLSSLSLLSS